MKNPRYLSALIMFLIFAPFMLAGSYFLFGLFAVCAYIACFELCRMHDDKLGVNVLYRYIIPVFSLLLVVILSLELAFGNSIRLYYFASIVIFSLICLVISLFDNKMKLTTGLYYIFCVLYTGIGFGLMARVRSISIDTKVNLMIGNFDFEVGGAVLFAFMLCTSMFTDIGAYFSGRLFGKKKLIPDVSPHKTVEGAIGGTIISSILSVLVLILGEIIFGFRVSNIEGEALRITLIVISAIILSIASQCGDLIASKLKREYGIKDYGKLFPGHGGIMDRFDSLLFTTLVFIVIITFFGVII